MYLVVQVSQITQTMCLKKNGIYLLNDTIINTNIFKNYFVERYISFNSRECLKLIVQSVIYYTYRGIKASLTISLLTV